MFNHEMRFLYCVCGGGVDSEGTFITNSHNSSNNDFFAPTKPTVVIPFFFATLTAFTIFLELPDVEIPKNTSPSSPPHQLVLQKNARNHSHFLLQLTQMYQ